MASIQPNTPIAQGVVAIFYYPVKHLGVVEVITEDGFYLSECNKSKGKCAINFYKFDDSRLKGFFLP